MGQIKSNTNDQRIKQIKIKYMFKLIPNFIKDKITNWAIQLFNIDVITPEQREEIQELLKADSEKAFNRMLEIFKETTQKQQKIINELTEENKELKEKVAELEEFKREITEALDKSDEVLAEWKETERQLDEQEAQMEVNKK